MRFLCQLACGLFICFASSLWAQSSASQARSTNQSWTDTSVSQSDAANPTRTLESHSQSGNRTLDNQSIQALGPDGNYQPFQDIEKETIKVDASTTRTITRTFGRDADGAKTLVQVTEEEQHTRAGGGSSVVRSTSDPDANGNLQLVQREIQETTISKSSNDGNEESTTKTTVMLPGPDGGLAPAMMTQEHSTQTGGTVNSTIESKKTTFLPDGSGNWQVGEVKETKTQEQGDTRTINEQVSRPDANGTLSQISARVSKESKDAAEKRSTEDDYSLNVPGTPQDGALHLVEREISTRSTPAPDEQNDTTRIEELNPGDPDAGLRVTIVTSDGVRTGLSGTRSGETIQQLDANGDLAVVSVDTTQSDSNHAIKVEIAPSLQPKQGQAKQEQPKQ
ncbi:MAG: hypothetical protein WA252_09080 [Candidatus Sulfotelmatobacter sp.]